MKSLVSCFLILLCVTAYTAQSAPVRVLVWDEQQPEQKRAYDGGFLGDAIVAYLSKQPGLTVKSANISQIEQGLADSDLNATDVLVWWGHVRQRDVKPEHVSRVVERVKAGKLSLIALHSAHWSQPFVRLMEERALADAKSKLSALEFKNLSVSKPEPYVAPKRNDPLTPSLARGEDGAWVLKLPNCCFPAFRPDGAPSHVTTLLPNHPIAQGLPATWNVSQTEMYDEPFHVPPPDQVIFEEHWDKGEHFRSGCVWKIGRGRVFYFRPGHEIFPVYKQTEPLRVVENAIRWLAKGGE
jgi:trehalose utilization protein